MQALTPSATSRVVALLGVALSVACLYFAKPILLPMAVAILLSFVVAPLADRFERLHIGRVTSTILVVAITSAVMLAIAWSVTDQAAQLSERLPEYKDNLLAKVHDLKGSAGNRFQGAEEVIKEIGAEISGKTSKAHSPNDAPANPPATNAPPIRKGSGGQDSVAVRVVELPPTPLTQLATVTEALIEPLAGIGGVVLLFTFILMRREDLRNRLIELLGRSDLHASTEVITEATRRVGRYLRMMLLINACYGCAVAAGLWLIGVPNPWLWGVLGIALRFLPYVGTWLAAAMPISLSIVVFSGWEQPLFVVLLFVVVEVLVNTVVEPWLYGSSTGVSPLGVILAAMFWTWLWGPVGLIVAMPLTVCLVVSANYVPALRVIATLIGDAPNLSLKERIYQRLLSFDEEEAGELAAEELGDTTVELFFDDTLLPILTLAAQSTHEGRLTDERSAFVVQGIRDLAQEADATKNLAEVPATAGEETPVRGRVLCIATDNAASEVAAAMTSIVLKQRGIDVDVASSNALANELVDQIEHDFFDVVLISAIPPRSVPGTRYLLKKFSSRGIKTAVVVGLWQGEHLAKTRQRLLADGATEVVATLADAAARIERIAARMPRPTVSEPATKTVLHNADVAASSSY